MVEDPKPVVELEEVVLDLNYPDRMVRICVGLTESIKKLVDKTAGCALLSFMDAFRGYHEGYCYKVMPFGLKNSGATYMHMVVRMFKSLIGKSMAAYVDDMLGNGGGRGGGRRPRRGCHRVGSDALMAIRKWKNGGWMTVGVVVTGRKLMTRRWLRRLNENKGMAEKRRGAGTVTGEEEWKVKKEG
nr:uncharacterized protein LOC109162262 [Ipomoea batatas]